MNTAKRGHPGPREKYYLINRLLWLATLMLIFWGLTGVGPGWSVEADLAADVVQGQKLFQRLGCQSCHALANTGGNSGPSLDGVGQRLTRVDLEQQLTQPGSRQPRTGMPSFAFLKTAELSALISFLQTLK